MINIIFGKDTKQGICLGLFAGLNIVALFLFQWYLLYKLGASEETDAFFASFTIPQLVIAMVGSSLMHVLVPILSTRPLKEIRKDAWCVFWLVGSFFAFISLMLAITAHLWIPLLFPGFHQHQLHLTIQMSYIQLLGMTFSAVNAVQWATYHARQRFIWAEFVPFISSLLVLPLLIWCLPMFGVIAGAWLILLRLTVQTVLLLPGMGRPSRPKLDSPILRTVWRRILPLLLGTAYYKTDPLIERSLLSTAPSGSLSLYYFAQQIYGAICQVINKAVASPLVPHLSNLFADMQMEKFQKTYYQRLLLVLALGLSCLLSILFIGPKLFNFLSFAGKFSAGNTSELFEILGWLSGMLIGGLLGQIASVSFYACGDTKTPTKLSMITYSLYIPCKILTFIKYGILGLAVATSLYYMLNFLLQVHFFRRKYLNVS